MTHVLKIFVRKVMTRILEVPMRKVMNIIDDYA